MRERVPKEPLKRFEKGPITLKRALLTCSPCTYHTHKSAADMLSLQLRKLEILGTLQQLIASATDCSFLLSR